MKGPSCLVRKLTVPARERGGCLAGREVASWCLSDWETLWFSPLLLLCHVTGMAHQTNYFANKWFKKKEINLCIDMEPSDYILSFALRRYCPTVFCVEYKTATKMLIFCGMKTNSIYSVEVKYLYIGPRSKWSVQVIEEISSRAGNWHWKVRFSSSILTIASLFLFLETFT